MASQTLNTDTCFENAFELLNRGYHQQVEEVKSLREKVKNLQETLETVQSEKSDLEKELKQLTAKSKKDAQKYQQEKKTLKVKLKVQEDTISKQADDLRELREEIETLELSLDENKFKRKIKNVKELLSSEKEEVESLKKQLSEERKARKEVEKKCKTMEGQISRFKGNLKKIVMEVEDEESDATVTSSTAAVDNKLGTIPKSLRMAVAPSIFIATSIFTPDSDTDMDILAAPIVKTEPATLVTPCIAEVKGQVPPVETKPIPCIFLENEETAASSKPLVRRSSSLKTKRMESTSASQLQASSPKMARMSFHSQRAPTQPVQSSNFIYSSIRTTNRLLETKDHALDKLKEQRLQAYFCICGVEFGSMDNLAAHVQYFALGCKFPCDYCKETFKTIGLLNEHWSTKHPKGEMPNKGKPGCTHCGVIFGSHLEIDRHYVHNTEKNHSHSTYCPLEVIKGK